MSWLVLLAAVAWSGDATIADALRAQKHCYKGDPAACEDAGTRYLHGVGVSQDEGLAIRLLDTACQAARPTACTELGEAYRAQGEFSARPKMVAAFRAGCGGGDADGCASLAELTRDAEGLGFDPAGARDLASKACDAGSAKGCAIAGELGGPEDLLRKSCQAGNARGCADLAERTAGSDPLAVTWAHTSCDAGSQSACFLVAAATRIGWGAPADPGLADQIADKACGSWMDCEGWGWALEYGTADTPRSDLLAREAYGAACRNNGWWACNAEARLLRHAGDLASSSAIYQRTCEADHPRVCHMDKSFTVGTTGPGNFSNQWVLHVGDCTDDHARACASLGWMDRLGLGAAPDPSAGGALTARACTLGRSEACGDLAFDGFAGPAPSATAVDGIWKASATDADSAVRVARMLYFSRLPPRDDRPGALDQLATTCAGGDSTVACLDVAVLAGPDGISRVESLCDHGTERACLAAAHVAPDLAAAKKRYQQACDFGLDAGCVLAGDPRAQPAVEELCAASEADCDDLAWARNLELVPGDPVEPAEKSCALGSLLGCHVLVDRQRVPAGAPWLGCAPWQTGCTVFAAGRPDEAALLEWACDDGDGAACAAVGHRLAASDPKAALPRLLTACAEAAPTDRGNAIDPPEWEACREAAKLDPSVAPLTTERACRLGISELCAK